MIVDVRNDFPLVENSRQENVFHNKISRVKFNTFLSENVIEMSKYFVLKLSRIERGKSRKT